MIIKKCKTPYKVIMTGLFIAIIINSCETADKPKQFPKPMACPGAETIEYGGETYPTVLIDEKCWLAKNLNIGHQLHSNVESTNNDTIEKYCYDNDPKNCDYFGALYQWDELMQYTSGDENQGICPPGWHVPSQDDFVQLILYVEGFTGYLMQNDTSWGDAINSVNSECPGCIGASGFDLLPAGVYSNHNNYFWGKGDIASFSNCSGISTTFRSFAISIFDEEDTQDILNESVRCIKDQ
jgi:uncharacterized protein (TIGR02145 family)